MLQKKLKDAYREGRFPYKHVIIDEGQDFGQERIEESEIITTLERIVLSDKISGSFYLFYDKNQLVQGSQIPQYIINADCKLTLYKNCRNTENIAITSMRPLGDSNKLKMVAGCVRGESPKVFILENEEQSIDHLDNTLEQLREEGISDIVILTCKTEESSMISQYCLDGYYQCNSKLYRFTTCRKFKGLEADAIILIDVTKKALNKPENLNFYVGASRARFYLNVICQMSEKDCMEVLTELTGKAEKIKRPKKALAAALNMRLLQ